MHHDVIIRNGIVVDGTGGPSRSADIAIRGDRISAVVDRADGGIDGSAANDIDADGRLVTPGFVQAPTTGDGMDNESTAGAHGVTSRVRRNCDASCLETIDDSAVAVNVGGLVDHDCATALLNRALGVSTTRDGLRTDELLVVIDELARRRAGVVDVAMPLGEHLDHDAVAADVELVGEISRRSRRPVTFGSTRWEALELVKIENARGANLRPRTPARGTDALFSLDSGTPFDQAPAWRELRTLSRGQRMQALRGRVSRLRLIDDADTHGTNVDLEELQVLPPGGGGHDGDPEWSLASIARHRGVSPAAAFIELAIETGGDVVASVPAIRRDRTAIEAMLDDPTVALEFDDGSHPTFYLSYWIRRRQRWGIEEAVRRLTSDIADLFGLVDRGRLAEGRFADVNVVDLDSLRLEHPVWVNDAPDGAGRWIQTASGYDHTFVNGRPLIEGGERTGELAGRLLRSV